MQDFVIKRTLDDIVDSISKSIALTATLSVESAIDRNVAESALDLMKSSFYIMNGLKKQFN